MKFLIDAHFPIRLKYWLIENGDDALHTLDLPSKNGSLDAEIIEKAEAEASIIITKDSDFIKFRIIYGKPSRLLMVTTGNIVNQDLIKLFESNFPTIKELFKAGRKVIEIDNTTITVHE